MDKYLSANEVAEKLNVPAGGVRRWVREGRLRGFYFGNGRMLRILESDLEKFIQTSEKKEEAK